MGSARASVKSNNMNRSTLTVSKAGAERYRREAEFHDRTFDAHARRATEGFYSITHSTSKALYRSYVLEHAAARRVLEYGCGPDGHSALLARHGARVIGIDLSAVAIAQNRKQSRRNGAEASEFCLMNAEILGFADASFDLVCGLGILHHLDLKRSLSEIARVLRPAGSAIFLEPLGLNPAINLYRWLTPTLRTPDEHPLQTADLSEFRNYFRQCEITYFHLTSLAAPLLRRTPWFDAVLAALERTDQFLFRRLPFLRKYAWAAAIVLTEPKAQTRSNRSRNAAA
jgi:SAM-dependent methyltransferase